MLLWLVSFHVLLIAAGFPCYFLYLHPRRGDRWTLPEPADEELA